MATCVLALALFLALSLALGSLALGALRLWRAFPARLVPVILVGVPLVAAALTVALALVGVEHPAAHAECHHDGHAEVAAHAPLDRGGLATALLPATVPLALLLAARMFSAAQRARAALSAEKGVRPLFPTKRGLTPFSPRVVAVDSGDGNARAAVWPRPHVVVDARWWRDLEPRDRDIVVAHEIAHLRRRDPVVAAAACLASAVLPRGAWNAAFARWKVWAEQAADLGAARATGDALAVADLLLRQHRARAVTAAPSPAMRFGSGTLEARVRALASGTTPPSALEPDLGAREVSLVVLAALLPLLGCGLIHRAAEMLLVLPH